MATRIWIIQRLTTKVSRPLRFVRLAGRSLDITMLRYRMMLYGVRGYHKECPGEVRSWLAPMGGIRLNNYETLGSTTRVNNKKPQAHIRSANARSSFPTAFA